MEHIQWRVTKMVGEMVHLPCEERPSEWGLFGLGKSGKLTVVCQHLQGGEQEDGARFFTEVHGRQIKGNGCKLKNWFRLLDIGRNFFTLRTAKYGNRGAGHSPLREDFKTCLDKALSNLVWPYGSLCFEQDAGQGPFQPDLSWESLQWKSSAGSFKISCETFLGNRNSHTCFLLLPCLR